MIRIRSCLAIGACVAPFAGIWTGLAAQEAPGEVRSADGVVIRYDVRGRGEPTLVLIHGWTNSREIWGRHPATLSVSHRVVAIDLAGHGASGSDRERWTMEAFGEDVVAVANHLGLDSVVLVGFSMGAAVALEAAERLPGRTLGVVLVDALHDPDRAAPPPEAVEQMMAQFRRSWGDTAFLRAFAFTPDAPDSLVQYLATISPPEPREHWFPIAHAMFAWSRSDLGPAIDALDAPLAAINTTRQPTSVDAFRRMAPTFTLDTMQGVGHAGILLQRVDDFDARLLAIVDRLSRQAR